MGGRRGKNKEEKKCTFRKKGKKNEK